MAVRPLYQDPFSPVLLSSTPLLVSVEQKMYIKKVLDRSSSDSLFSDKAYAAITKILTSDSVKVPTVSSLNPGSATVGDPDFTLHVMGTNFTPESVIVFNGGEEITVYVSATELTTGVNMATVTGAYTVPVAVLSSDGVLSEPVNFVFQDAATLAALKQKSLTQPKVVPPPPTKPTEVKK